MPEHAASKSMTTATTPIVRLTRIISLIVTSLHLLAHLPLRVIETAARSVPWWRARQPHEIVEADGPVPDRRDEITG
jgi:hypothetical protein